MIVFEKTSEIAKAINQNDRQSKFQDKISRFQELIAKKEATIERKVEAHRRRITRVTSNVASLKKLGIQSKADYSEVFADFKENILPVNSELLAGLIDDRLHKDLALCTSADQEEICVRYHKMNAEATLDQIERMKEFYETVGCFVEPVKKVSATRSRRRKPQEQQAQAEAS